MKSRTIVAYTYRADSLCPDCIRNIGIMPLQDTPITGPVPVEDLLNQAARYKGINRTDEHSYDSGDFPKAISADQVEGEECCWDCQEPLIG